MVDNRLFEIPFSIDGNDARNEAAVVTDALRKSADQYVLAWRSTENASPQ